MPHTIKAPRPRKLEISIGGYPDGYYTVAYRNKRLLYSHGYGSDEALSEIEQPSDEQWQSFLAEINRFKVWDWKENYRPDTLICDGTQWSLWITWGRRKVVSNSDNSYPDNFQTFLKAIRKLIGNKEFS